MQRKLLALLTTSSLYLKTAHLHISEISGMNDGKSILKSLEEKTCGNVPAYAIFEELRNHSQHVDLPIWSFGLGSEKVPGQEAVEHGVNIGIQREMLTGSRRKNNKRSAIENLDSRFDLRTGARDYLDCLAKLHTEIWNVMKQHMQLARATLTELENRWSKLHEHSSTVGLVACHIHNDILVNTESKSYLKLEQDKYLEYLEKRLSRQASLKTQRIRHI